MQSVVILAMAGLVGVPYAPVMMVQVLLLLFLMSFLITALGLLLAARIKQIQAAMPLVQLIITPMMFLSGALFPLSNLPGWLDVAVHVNPMTYAVEPVRSVVFDHLDVAPPVRAALDPGVSWGAWHLPVWFQVLLVMAMSAVVLATAVWRFSRTE